jgi:hypothetical protein
LLVGLDRFFGLGFLNDGDFGIRDKNYVDVKNDTLLNWFSKCETGSSGKKSY